MFNQQSLVVSGGLTLPNPYQSFGIYVVEKLKEFTISEKVAMINGETQQSVTYEKFLQTIGNIASGLQKLGIKQGDVVALFSEKCMEYIAAIVAAVCIGAIVTTFNVKSTKDEILHTMNISKPRLIFSSEAVLLNKLNILQGCEHIEYIVQLGGPVGANVLPLDALLQRGSGGHFRPAAVQRHDTAFIFYSSGTTGLPKGVMLTHNNVISGTSIFNYSSENDARVLTIMPWYHIYGLLTTIQYIISGNLLVYLNNFIFEHYLTCIEKYRITEMTAVPSIVTMLAKSELVKIHDLSSVKKVWSAAAPLSMDTIASANNNLPNSVGIFQCYGMTETTLAIIKEDPKHYENGFKKSGSCGVPLPGIEAKVVDVNTRLKLGPNEVGEVCVRGPTIMKGYVDNETATRDIIDTEGYLKTGDLGYYDQDGCFYIVDRLKDIIKYKGQQVAPASVESVVLQHGGVAECGVVGAPDESAGELPTAFVVLKPGATVSEDDLLQFTNSKLSPACRLRGGVKFIEEIPKNGSGKILRRELRNKLIGTNK